METYSNYSDVGANNATYGGNEDNFSNETENQQSWIPEQFRGGILDRFEKPEDLCKAYMNLNSLMAKRREDFSLQDKQAFLQMREEALNIPQTPNDYRLDISPCNIDGKIVENYLGDEELDLVKDMSSRLGLTNEQAQTQCDMINEYLQDQITAQDEQLEAVSVNNGSVLGQMWGDNIEACIADVATGIEVAANGIGCDVEDLKRELEYPMAELCSPNLINLFRNLGTIGGRGYGHGMSAGMTPVDASNQLAVYSQSQEFKDAVRKGGPALAAAMKQLDVLTKRANGEI